MPRTNGYAGKGQQSEFAKRAARIGLGIHSTSQKLNKLALLAKRTSMFDDPAAEINDLTGEDPIFTWDNYLSPQCSWASC